MYLVSQKQGRAEKSEQFSAAACNWDEKGKEKGDIWKRNENKPTPQAS